MFWPATLSKSDLLKTSCMIFPEALKQVISRAPKDSTQVLLISAVFKSFVWETNYKNKFTFTCPYPIFSHPI